MYRGPLIYRRLHDIRGRRREEKRRPGSAFRLAPDPAAVALNHSLADCETQSRSAAAIVSLQPLEQREDLGVILRFDAGSVVPNGKFVESGSRVRPGRDIDLQKTAVAAVFD